MSSFKPSRIWLKNEIDADDHKNKVRTKYLKLMEENPDVAEYVEWVKSQKTGNGFIIGVFFAVFILITFIGFYVWGVLTGRGMV